MDGFDPLFDDEIVEQRPFSLSLPTFEFAPPSTSCGDNDLSEFFDQNVGTIALLGSHDSEHSQASSTLAPDSTGSKTPTKKRSRGQRSASKQSPALRVQQPYIPQSLHDMVLGQLAKDPNVIPLLQAIVEYVYKTNLAPAQPSLPKTPSAPAGGDTRPAKRRRLQRIPAGAEGWTVPFPFPQGEGPQHYQETWEMKRLIVLLGSLLRNLKNWRGQHGTVPFTTQPQKRTYRKQSSVATSGPSVAPAGPSGSNDPFLDGSFLSNLQIPNPADFDLSLESLLSVLTSYEGNNESTLNVNLGALSNGAPISDVFFATPAQSEQIVPWEHYMSFSNPSTTDGPEQPQISPYQASSQHTPIDVDSQSIGLPMFPMEITPQDTPELSHGSAKSTEPSLHPGDNNMLNNMDANHFHDGSFSGLGLNIADPQALRVQQASLPDDELQDLLNMVLSSASFTPSITESPSIATPVDIGPSQMSTPKQPDSAIALPTSTQTPSQSVSRAVAAVSKRGKGRTTAALRRDLNKQLRQNAVEGAIFSPGSISLALAPPQPVASGIKGKKMRASQSTVKKREELLERAKEWRDVMVKELEMARVTRWEVTVEGLVLREIGILVRNGEGGPGDVEMEE